MGNWALTKLVRVGFGGPLLRTFATGTPRSGAMSFLYWMDRFADLR